MKSNVVFCDKRISQASSVLMSLMLLAGCRYETTPSSPASPLSRVSVQDAATLPALTVTAAVAKQQEWVHRIPLDAEVIALSSPVISAEVAAKVIDVRVTPGQSVKKGQVLVVLDNSDLSLSANEAAAQLAHYQAQLDEKRHALARDKELAANGFISRAALEATQAQTQALKQQLKAAQMRADLAQRHLAKTMVRAPYDAVVSTRAIAPGGYVRAGDALLTLWSPKASALRLRIPQQYAGMVQPGQSITVQWNGEEIATEVLYVRSDIDTASRSFEAQAQVPLQLRAITGAALPAWLEIKKEAVLSVPLQAIQYAGSKAYLFTIDERMQAQKRLLEVGRQQGSHTEVIKGVAEGDIIIVDGAAFAREGQKVQLQGTEVPKQDKYQLKRLLVNAEESRSVP